MLEYQLRRWHNIMAETSLKLVIIYIAVGLLVQSWTILYDVDQTLKQHDCVQCIVFCYEQGLSCVTY